MPLGLGGAKPIEEASKSKQILDTERRAAGGHDHERVGRIHIGPARRQAAQLGLLAEEEHSILGPVARAHDQVELLASERMERVGYPYSLLSTRPIRSNRRFGPKGWSKTWSDM